MLANLLITTLVALLLGGSGWYLITLAHYIRSGQYEVDQRLGEISRQ